MAAKSNVGWWIAGAVGAVAVVGIVAGASGFGGFAVGTAPAKPLNEKEKAALTKEGVVWSLPCAADPPGVAGMTKLDRAYVERVMNGPDATVKNTPAEHAAMATIMRAINIPLAGPRALKLMGEGWRFWVKPDVAATKGGAS